VRGRLHCETNGTGNAEIRNVGWKALCASPLNGSRLERTKEQLVALATERILP